MLSQVVWVTLSKVIGKKATFMGGIVYYGIVLVGFYLVLPSSEAMAAGTTNLGLITLFIFLIGAANGCYQQLPWSMMPDLVDWSARRENFKVEGGFQWALAAWTKGRKRPRAAGSWTIAGPIRLDFVHQWRRCYAIARGC